MRAICLALSAFVALVGADLATQSAFAREAPPPGHAKRDGPPPQARGDAPPPGHARRNQNFLPQGSAYIGLTFDSGIERVVRDYFVANPLAPRGLPPGIAKNYARGKPLPPGIAKRYLPGDLRARLPEYPGYEVVIVDGDVLLIAAATGIVADILFNVL